MGDILKVIAFLSCGGFGVGAVSGADFSDLKDLKIQSLNMKEINRVAGVLEQKVDKAKNQATEKVNKILERVGRGGR
jgi:hypothetical protein